MSCSRLMHHEGGAGNSELSTKPNKTKPPSSPHMKEVHHSPADRAHISATRSQVAFPGGRTLLSRTRWLDGIFLRRCVPSGAIYGALRYISTREIAVLRHISFISLRIATHSLSYNAMIPKSQHLDAVVLLVRHIVAVISRKTAVAWILVFPK